MKFPPFTTDPLIAIRPRPLTDLGREPYVAFSTEAWTAVSSLQAELDDLLRKREYQFRTTFLGLSGLGGNPALMLAEGHWWLLQPGTIALNRCDRATVEALAAAGHEFDATAVRIARKMPSGWEPLATMKQVNDRAFHGPVTEPDATSLALPFIVNGGTPVAGKRWAAYVAVDIEAPPVNASSTPAPVLP